MTRISPAAPVDPLRPDAAPLSILLDYDGTVAQTDVGDMVMAGGPEVWARVWSTRRRTAARRPRLGCKGETTRSFSYLGPDIGLLGGERHRLILLDLGDGDVLAIVIRTTDPAAFDAFVVEAMPIVESLRFE